MKVGDLVKLTYNDLVGIVISDADKHGWYEVLDANGNKWECNGLNLEVISEGR